MRLVALDRIIQTRRPFCASKGTAPTLLGCRGQRTAHSRPSRQVDRIRRSFGGVKPYEGTTPWPEFAVTVISDSNRDGLGAELSRLDDEREPTDALVEVFFFEDGQPPTFTAWTEEDLPYEVVRWFLNDMETRLSSHDGSPASDKVPTQLLGPALPSPNEDGQGDGRTGRRPRPPLRPAC